MSTQNNQSVAELPDKPKFLELTPRHKVSDLEIGIALIIVALVSFISLYVVFEKYQALSRSVLSVSVMKTNSIVYQNHEYGFEVALPESWKGYKISETSKDIYAVNGSTGQKVVGHFPLIEIINPLSTTTRPMQNIPIEVFTLGQWKHVGSEQTGDWSVSAAPIPPSELGRNNIYVFALPARYNFAYLPGFEEVQKIIDSHPLKTFEPVATTSADTSDWQAYKNDKYGFEFAYPKTMKLSDTSATGFGGYNLSDNSGTGIKIFINSVSATTSLIEYLSKFDKKKSESKDTSLITIVKNSVSTTVSDANAIKRKEILGYMKLPAESVYVLHGGYAYQISVWDNALDWDKTFLATGKRPTVVDAKSLEIFSNFISTFKFADSNSADTISKTSPIILEIHQTWGPCVNPDQNACSNDRILYASGKLIVGGHDTGTLSSTEIAKLVSDLMSSKVWSGSCTPVYGSDIFESYVFYNDGKAYKAGNTGCKELQDILQPIFDAGKII